MSTIQETSTIAMTSISADFSSTSTAMNNESTNSDCQLFPEPEKCEILLDIKRASSSLSIIGSLFSLSLIVLFRKYREPSQRMIAQLSLATFLLGVAFLLDDKINTEATVLCKVQGALIMWSILVCFLWIICMLFNLYFQLLFHFDYRKYELAVTFACWGMPVLSAAIPFADDAYEPAGAWCWLRNDAGWRFGLWYAWRITFVFVFIIIMAHIFWKLNKIREQQATTAHDMTCFQKDLQSLKAYPIIYFILNLFPVTNRIQNLVSGSNKSDFTLWVLQALTDPLFGVTVAVMYTFDSHTRKSLNRTDIAKAFRSWFQKNSRVKEYSVTTSYTNEQDTTEGVKDVSMEGVKDMSMEGVKDMSESMKTETVMVDGSAKSKPDIQFFEINLTSNSIVL